MAALLASVSLVALRLVPVKMLPFDNKNEFQLVLDLPEGTTLESTDRAVRATSSDGSFNMAVMTINLNDVDEFDVAAVSDSDAAANAVDENAANGTVVGVTALASDADATNNTITYTLDDDAGGRFAVDASTGMITVAGSLDYATHASHDVTVQASSNDASTATATFSIAVSVVCDVPSAGTVRSAASMSSVIPLKVTSVIPKASFSIRGSGFSAVAVTTADTSSTLAALVSVAFTTPAASATPRGVILPAVV